VKSSAAKPVTTSSRSSLRDEAADFFVALREIKTPRIRKRPPTVPHRCRTRYKRGSRGQPMTLAARQIRTTHEPGINKNSHGISARYTPFASFWRRIRDFN
jgi:hypothetical protein